MRAALLGAILSRATPATIPVIPVGGVVAGVNWQGSFDYGAVVFINAMEQARGFGAAGTFEADPSLARDANGWPSVASQIVVSLPDGRPSGMPLGTWKGSCVTTGTITGAGVSNVQKVGDNATFDWVVTTGTEQLIIGFSAGVSDLKVLAPGYTTDADVFLPEVATYLTKFPMIRWAFFVSANDYVGTTWANRPKRAAGTKNRSWESMVAGINRLYTESGGKCRYHWVCVPSTVDAAYQSALFAYLRDNVDPGVTLYLEWSNEVWNTSPAFKTWFELLAWYQANRTNPSSFGSLNFDGRPVGDATSGWNVETEVNIIWRRWAREVVEMADRAKSVFGAAAKGSRYRVVLATQQGRASEILPSQFAYINAAHGSPGNWIDQVAAGGYLGSDDGTLETATTVSQMLGILRTTGTYNLATYTPARLNAIKALSDAQGIARAPICYEWGIHMHDLLGYSGAEYNFNNVSLKRDAQRSAGMGTLVRDLYAAIVAAGWDVGAYFNGEIGPYAATTANDCNSHWPVAESYTVVSPKLQGLLDGLASQGVS